MHLFYKENIWSNPHAISCIHPVIQTSTIILQTELFPKKRREKISKERYFNLQVQCFYTESIHSTRVTAHFQCLQSILHTELILPQEILQLQDSSCADQYKASSSDCSPCIQTFYIVEQGSKRPYSIPGPDSTGRLPLILPGRNSILSGSQHPRTPYSSS